MEPILKLEHIQKYYGNGGNITKAIQDISFSVSEGEFLGIMGASGSGKTTLLNCISTIDTVSAGHIYLEGTDVTELRSKSLARFRRENLGFVFQDFNLLDTLTISENIAMALAINGAPAGEVEPRIREMAEKLNIRDILDKYPYQVSGGQKQRCACARAIINHPKLLLADEPTGALDSHSAQMLLSTIQRINEQLNATILMVTHDAFTASYAGRILFLQDGKIFTELNKGSDSRSAFFEKILHVLTLLGGGESHVCYEPAVAGPLDAPAEERRFHGAPLRASTLLPSEYHCGGQRAGAERPLSSGPGRRGRQSVPALCPGGSDLSDLRPALSRQQLSRGVEGGGAGTPL